MINTGYVYIHRSQRMKFRIGKFCLLIFKMVVGGHFKYCVNISGMVPMRRKFHRSQSEIRLEEFHTFFSLAIKDIFGTFWSKFSKIWH